MNTPSHMFQIILNRRSNIETAISQTSPVHNVYQSSSPKIPESLNFMDADSTSPQKVKWANAYLREETTERILMFLKWCLTNYLPLEQQWAAVMSRQSTSESATYSTIFGIVLSIF